MISKLMEDYLENFYLRLQDNEFEPDETKTNWTGRVSIEWENAKNGVEETAEHVITIYLPEGFPYCAPIVLSKDDPPLASSWHLNTGDPPTLCLWDSETGWKPDYTAHKLLNRITDWFYHYHTDTWPANSQVPDLHRYLKKIGTVIIGEDWKPQPDVPSGQLTLWRSKKHTITPSVASCSENRSEPEPRIADNIILGKNPMQLRGAWFRVPEPFVPLNHLSEILSQIDQLTQKPSGWSVKKCIAATGLKATGGGFPIAIGYPDNFEKERWLFLWCKFPEGAGKRYRWSSHQKLRQIEVNSFQTAPASKEAFLRRSAYMSKSLTSKRVVLFGVGALGGSIALLLAKAGVGELRLIDSDDMMPGNVMRHICGLDYVGFQKRTAVKHVINRHNPDCYVECFTATWHEDELKKYIQNSDLVVDATGNTNFSLYLNKLCVELNQPISFVAAYRRAKVGRIVLRLSNEAPCFACYWEHPNDWPDNEYPIIPASPKESFIEDGCGLVTEEAVALDVEAVANFGTRQILRFLQGKEGEGNLGIIVNEPLPDTQSSFLGLTGMYFWANRVNKNCLVCKI